MRYFTPKSFYVSIRWETDRDIVVEAVELCVSEYFSDFEIGFIRSVHMEEFLMYSTYFEYRNMLPWKCLKHFAG